MGTRYVEQLVLHLALTYAAWSRLPGARPVTKPRLCEQKREYCFSYNRRATTGPNNWDRVCDTGFCFNGHNQSPILIDPSTVDSRCDRRNTLTYNRVRVSGKLENDGYYPKVAADNRDMRKAVLRGVPGADNCRYLLDSLHVHFGRRGDRRGSEHVVSGKHYDAELHLVHNREYNGGSGFEAGQAVVGIPLSLTEGRRNFQLDEILNAVARIATYNGTICEDRVCQASSGGAAVSEMMCPHWKYGKNECGQIHINFNPRRLLPPLQDFYYYYGSLTTPTLSESVLWHFMKTPLRITRRQLSFMRRLESRFRDRGGKIPIFRYGNLRPLQPRNNRKVYGNICTQTRYRFPFIKAM